MAVDGAHFTQKKTMILQRCFLSGTLKVPGKEKDHVLLACDFWNYICLLKILVYKKIWVTKTENYILLHSVVGKNEKYTRGTQSKSQI